MTALGTSGKAGIVLMKNKDRKNPRPLNVGHKTTKGQESTRRPLGSLTALQMCEGQRSASEIRRAPVQIGLIGTMTASTKVQS
jgi:hypothetical protein